MQVRDGASGQGQAVSRGHNWEDEQALKHLTTRTADQDARFMLHLLQPGIALLDCGCGPGTITLGLAARVDPGEVMGLDSNPNMIQIAQAAAAEQDVDNARFETGDAQALPYGDETFDVAFSHALLEHLAAPAVALAEMTRALKSGGWIALRVPDWGGNLLHPNPGNLQARLTAQHERQFVVNGSDPYRGRQVGVLLSELGFADLRVTASYTSLGTPAEVAAFAQTFVGYFLAPAKVPMILENRWATQEEIEQLKEDLLAWAQTPGAFHARAWVEVVARKP